MKRPARTTAQTAVGRVVAAHGRHFRVELETTVENTVEGAGATLDCVTRGKQGGIACGDRVLAAATGAGGGVIESLLPRRNLLYRSDLYRRKLLAANLDQIFIVLAAEPTPDLALLDRCLVAAEAADIPARIVVNKTDLPGAAALLDALAGHAALGYPLIPISAHADVSTLQTQLAGQTSILVGASGVGKSTLVNALVPTAGIATQAISTALDSGKHTTTHTRLHRLPGGGALIDSPGMQEFGLKHLAASDLPHAFPEFRPRLGQCRFYNCRHLQEPGCAILAACERGEIAPARWRVYRDLVEENERTLY